MRSTTKWSIAPRGSSVVPLHHSRPANERPTMPTRGYRKGISDRKVPRPQVIKIRLSAAVHRALIAEAHRRAMTLSRLGDAVLSAHVRRSRAELPQPRGPLLQLTRELRRLGNNLNQIARQANLLRLALLEGEARLLIGAINRAVARLPG